VALAFAEHLLLLYCCFTAALLLLYCCFTAALLLLYCCCTLLKRHSSLSHTIAVALALAEHLY
jgi:hypothetical protein